MLRLVDNSAPPGYDRREFLRIGGLGGILGLGGLSLPGLLASKAAAAEAAEAASVLRGKSVVFCFMHGGPSQTETFDPKMTAPAGVRSATGEIQTALPGVTFGGTFEKLAKIADKFSILRSFVTGDGNHDIKTIVGKETLGANLGSIYSRVAGTNDAKSGMPTNAALFPRAVDASTMEFEKQFGDFTQAGTFGAAYRPFVPGAGGEMQKDMELAIPMNRLDDRRYLLGNLDQARFAAEAAFSGLDRVREQAYSTILGGAAAAFDLSKEDAKTIERYDTAPLVRPEQISRKWNNYERYVDNAKSLGKLMLLARRLCEAGCGFVTVTTNFVWDMHADDNNAGVEEGMKYMGVPFDHAISAFIEDCQQRGLSDKILLVCCGEMGRTPRMNAAGGRDHWGNIAPLLLSGGGLNMGQVIGQSTRDAGEPLTTPYTVKHLVNTILHTLFDVGQLRVQRNVPTEILRMVNGGEGIGELM